MDHAAYYDRYIAGPDVDDSIDYDEGTEPWEDEDLLDWEYDPSVKEQRA